MITSGKSDASLAKKKKKKKKKNNNNEKKRKQAETNFNRFMLLFILFKCTFEMLKPDITGKKILNKKISY